MRALLLCGVAVGLLATGCSRSEMRTIEIGIEHSRFLPERIEVASGETVRFIVTNGDPIDHEFILGDVHVQASHEEGTEAHHGNRPGEISIAPGATEETTYTFPDSGELIFGCHLPQHYDYGMRGIALVTT